MLWTVEAEVNVDGTVRLLEPLRVSQPSRALLTLLEPQKQASTNGGNVVGLQRLIQSPEFANRKSYPPDKIEANIQELRDSWE
jgi:hypothetical protein